MMWLMSSEFCKIDSSAKSMCLYLSCTNSNSTNSDAISMFDYYSFYDAFDDIMKHCC